MWEKACELAKKAGADFVKTSTGFSTGGATPEDIKLILNERKDARKNKNFAKSDELRDKLKELGYIVKDTKDGQIIEKV